MFNENPNVGILDPLEAKTVHFLSYFRNLLKNKLEVCLQ